MTNNIETIVRTEKINKSYANKSVLQNISLEIKKNDCVGLIGKNGAGKTTLLKILTGLLEPDSGAIFYNGEMGLSINFKNNIGFYLGNEYLPEELTGRQYINFLNQIYSDRNQRKTQEQIEEMFAYFFEEKNALDTKISKYSMGMTQKIGICGALVHQPRLLILDEPFTGLDPLSCITLIDFLNFYRQTHTLIISSHDLSYMEKICNQIVLIDSGTIIYDGGIEKFTKNGQSSLETSFLGAIEAPLVRKEIKWII